VLVQLPRAFRGCAHRLARCGETCGARGRHAAGSCASAHAQCWSAGDWSKRSVLPNRMTRCTTYVSRCIVRAHVILVGELVSPRTAERDVIRTLRRAAAPPRRSRSSADGRSPLAAAQRWAAPRLRRHRSCERASADRVVRTGRSGHAHRPTLVARQRAQRTDRRSPELCGSGRQARGVRGVDREGLRRQSREPGAPRANGGSRARLSAAPRGPRAETDQQP
jgi:hypothetical protein